MAKRSIKTNQIEVTQVTGFTGNLFELRNSAGSLIYSIDQTGAQSGGGGALTGPGSSVDNGLVRFNGTGGNSVQGSTAIITDFGGIVNQVTDPAEVAIRLRGHATQSAKLFELHRGSNDDLVLSIDNNGSITSSGDLTINNIITNQLSRMDFNSGAGNNAWHLSGTMAGTDFLSMLQVRTNKASNRVLILKAETSQTANIQENRAQTDAVLSGFDPVGVYLAAERGTTPSTPAAGFQKLYPKTDGFWYQLDDAAVETQLGGSSGANLTLSNLTNTIAIPDGVHLTPLNTLQVNLGSASKKYSEGYINTVYSPNILNAFSGNTPLNVDTVANTATGAISIRTGAASAGASGGINLITGTATTTQGEFRFIKSGQTTTTGYVWTASATDGTGYWASPGGGSGDVVGPASSVDGNIVTYDGATGKLVQDSAIAALTLSGDLLENSWDNDQPSLIIDGTTAAATATASAGIIFKGSGNKFFVVETQDVTGASDTADFWWQTGHQSGTANSGNIYFASGDGDGDSGNTGNVQIQTGNNSKIGGNSGNLTLATGGSQGSSGSITLQTNAAVTASGNISLQTSSSATTQGKILLNRIDVRDSYESFAFDTAPSIMIADSSNASSIQLCTEDRTNTSGNTKDVYIMSGSLLTAASTGSTGTVQIQTGFTEEASSNGNSGPIFIGTGSVSGGNSGHLFLDTGTSDTGIRGNIKIQCNDLEITIDDAIVANNVRFSGLRQIRTGGTAPSIAPNANAGSGATCTVTAGSTDLSGQIVLTTGTGVATGIQFTLTFNQAFPSGSFVVLENANSNASNDEAQILRYMTSSSTTFDLNALGTATASTEYRWNYVVVGR